MRQILAAAGINFARKSRKPNVRTRHHNFAMQTLAEMRYAAAASRVSAWVLTDEGQAEIALAEYAD